VEKRSKLDNVCFRSLLMMWLREMVSLIPRLSSFAVSGTPAKTQIADLIHVLKYVFVIINMPHWYPVDLNETNIDSCEWIRLSEVHDCGRGC
jgi:hypothetical protein